MRILMLSWEYPPVSYGGLARHVQDICEAMVKQGQEVYVVTQGGDDLPEDEVVKGVHVLRTKSVDISPNNFIDSILHLNYQLLEKAFFLIKREGNFDLIHGHDWLVFWASKVLKHSLTKPLLYTIHATENGRNQGIHNDDQRYINDLEWYATYEAWKVIVCSHYMKDEVSNLFQLPDDKTMVIPNGVKEENYRTFADKNYRNNFAEPDEKIIFYIGRMVREKGIHVLLGAVPKILKIYPNTKFILAGKGPYLDYLKSLAWELGINDHVIFTGFVGDETRNKLYQIADLAVFPSLYEPFGIVALEAMITKTPLIASRVGGLAEFVEDNKNGLMVNPDNSYELAGAILTLLQDEARAKRLARRGYELAKEKYTWSQIASRTLEVYREVLREYEQSDWSNLAIDGYQEEESVVNRYLKKRKYS